jgi:DNA-binding NtrC family response regulator
MDKILLVEDELIVARDLQKVLEKAGHKVFGVARTVEKALLLIQETRPLLVLVDIFLKGDLTGIDLAARLNHEDIPFIFISANSNKSILQAVKTTDPYGFIVKPFRGADLLVTIDIALYRYAQKKELSNRLAVSEQTATTLQPLKAGKPVGSPSVKPNLAIGGLVTKSAAVMNIINQIQQVAPYDTSVLLLGESGTGKEVIANLIYKESNRRNKPYIKINCAAIPIELMDADFFGYEKGAYTGATERKAGKFEMANGGTILLDEIGEMPIDTQSKLLRVLQEKEIQRIGSNVTVKTDVRIIAATNRDLEKEIEEGRFRLDLYYRLLVFPIALPPLRERKEDIPLLVDHFIHHYNNIYEKQVLAVDASVLQQLMEYDWPGNIRELQFLIERSVLTATDQMIREVQLPEPYIQIDENPLPAPKRTLEEIDRDHVLAILEYCQFKVSGKGGAAELLNLAPTTLHAKIKKFGIKKFYL